MAFRKGNQYWRNVDNPGTQRKYKPKELWDKAFEYFEDNDKKAWSKQDFIKSGPQAGQMIYLDTQNPPSLNGFCLYAGITLDTFRNYGKIDDEYLAVTSTIREIVYTIQFDGATVNVFNANIIARKIGLIDRKEVELKSDMTDDERVSAIKTILEKAKKINGEDLI